MLMGNYELLEDTASELLDSADLMFFTVSELQTSLSETEGCYRVVAFLSTDLLNQHGGWGSNDFPFREEKASLAPRKAFWRS